jgi:site-specific DNA-methyltransferase (adenine-specific)
MIQLENNRVEIIGNQTLINGDCLEVMDKLIEQGVQVDLIIIDPPYGKDYKSNYSNSFDKIINDDNLNWISDFFHKANNISKDNSHLYCFTSFEYIGEFMLEIKKYWKVKNLIVVPRTMRGGLGDLKSSYSPQNEFIIFATKGNRKFEETQILKPSEVYLKDKRNSPKEWIYRLPDYWDWVKVSVQNLKRVHPTEKTEEVIDIMVKMSSKEGDVILDAFMGSGTTGIVAKKLNRDFIGIELDEKHFGVAKNRLK